jgi:hypothetical protein
MAEKPTSKIFRLNAIIAGHIVAGKVAISPAPESGILTEVARLDAERLLRHIVGEDIAAGRIGRSAMAGADETPGGG